MNVLAKPSVLHAVIQKERKKKSTEIRFAEDRKRTKVANLYSDIIA